MNWLDNLIAWISPAAGAKRAAWRSEYESLRHYDAGSNHRLNANWWPQNWSAEVTDRQSRDTVRARARDLERNSDFMSGVLGAYKRNVVGSGFTLQAQTGKDELNTELEQLWKRWCKSRNCDVTGTQSFTEMLRMAVVRKKVDGGILFVKRYTSDGIVPFSLQMIEVDELDTNHIGTTNSENKTVGGIEYNKYNRPVGYWIRQYAIDGYTVTEPVYIKASDVIFYYTKRRPSQIREMSDMSPTITRIRDANEFMTAVSVKQRIEACLSVFIKKSVPAQGIGRGAAADNAGKHSYDGKTLTPGMIKELNAGDDVQVVNPLGQSADATSFTKLQQRLIAAGQGLSYETASRDMSETNYSSARQGLIEDGMTYLEEVEQLTAVIDEIYETFVISCVLAGLVNIRNFWNDKDTYLAHTWIRAPKAWIDPQKESNATKTALETGQKTFQQVAAESGRDWRQVIDDMAEAVEYADSKGLDLRGILYGTKENKAAQPEETAPGTEPDDADSVSAGTEPAEGSEPAEE